MCVLSVIAVDYCLFGSVDGAADERSADVRSYDCC